MESRQPLARWNRARGVWETATVSLLCGHSEPFSQTWPTSGMTRRGTAYELPTWEQRTGGSACSSSPGLPTPTAMDSKASGGSGPSNVTLTDFIVRGKRLQT